MPSSLMHLDAKVRVQLLLPFVRHHGGTRALLLDDPAAFDQLRPQSRSQGSSQVGTTLGPIGAGERETATLAAHHLEINPESSKDLFSPRTQFDIAAWRVRGGNGLLLEQSLEEGNSIAACQMVIAGASGDQVRRFPMPGGHHSDHQRQGFHQLPNRSIAQGINDLSPVARGAHQVALSQERQVIGNFRLRLAHQLHQFGDRGWTLHELLEDTQSQWVCQGLRQPNHRCVLIHLFPSTCIHQQTMIHRLYHTFLMCQTFYRRRTLEPRSERENDMAERSLTQSAACDNARHSQNTGHPPRWAILAVLSAVAFMAQLDFSS